MKRSDALKVIKDVLIGGYDSPENVILTKLEDTEILPGYDYYTGGKIARKALKQGKEDTQTYCKDCGMTTKSGSGSARCPSCWDDRFGGKENG